MSQKEKLIAKLILKYLEGSCSVKEIRKLNNWIESDIKNKEFFIKIIDPTYLQKELDILNKRYYLDYTHSEIAQELGISQAQVSRLEKQALKCLKKNFE